MLRSRLFALALVAVGGFAASIGPERGTLIIAGGGTLGPEIMGRFIELAGGTDSPMVFIPTAEEVDPPKATAQDNLLTRAGCTHVTILHTRDRKVADSAEFVRPLETARAVWFEGGRQWRLVDSYLNTRTEREIRGVLERGGVVGGTSAGATIQGSYLVRGAREGNTIMMAPGYEAGMGFLKNAAIDQHIITRHRENDLNAVIDRHPGLLGIGIDEGTAIVVQGDRFEVVGKSKVFLHDAGHAAADDGKKYYTLVPGDWFDLQGRRPVAR